MSTHSSSTFDHEAGNEPRALITRMRDNLRHIRDWLVNQPHLRAKTDDQWLLSFLRGCKFSLQRTKEKLDMFYTTRTLVPEYFDHRDPLLHDIQEFLKQNHLVLLPKAPDPSRPRTILISTKNADPEKFNPTIAIKILLMILDILLMEDTDFMKVGLQTFIDLQDMPHKCVMQLTPSTLNKIAVIFKSAYPIKLKGVHFVNSPPYFKTLLPLLKTFASERISDRIIHANSYDTLYKAIPPSVLPKEYGGEGGYMHEMAGELNLKLESYRDWFLKDAAYCSDETRRPGKSKTFTDVFGVEASFGKLDLDYQEYVIAYRQKYRDL